MKGLVGRPGSVSGLLLRLGQFSCAAASIGVMVSSTSFATYTAFCYLIASMGLQVLWSFGLACLDVYALRRKRDLQNPILVSLFVVGDWVTATLSLAAASSSAGIVVLYAKDMNFCALHSYHLPCTKYQVSVALAFITWALISMSSHVMFWILLNSV
ncbi:CASP-like protein 5B2 [Ziziphus jujuba]|uniref:CASP-like protein n=1 Tax=Ziziphus jujuba TaxID=326968 RepID=A0A6P4B506_ZIZJJ|nr:CASP-like protein 5B2 [Ziziphus jujuba]